MQGKPLLTARILNLLVLLTSMLGYLQWGTDQSSFLFQAEWEVLRKLFTHPIEALHPFTVLPMLGQILLLVSLFQAKPSKVLTFLGIGGIGLLLVLLFFIGLISLNFPILGSVIPFMVVAFFAIRIQMRSWKG
jgi:type IV secretory pathway VirB6-like protein